MPAIARRLVLLLFILDALIVRALHAQPADTIRANPNGPAMLRAALIIFGKEQQFVGRSVAGIPDMNGDGIDEFSMQDLEGHHLYYGRREPLDTTSIAVLPCGGRLIVGDFWGTGHRAVGGWRTMVEGTSRQPLFEQGVYLYRTESGGIDTSKPVFLDAQKALAGLPLVRINDAVGADLDGDGADELIVATGSSWWYDSASNTPGELWIYRGGPNFQVDSPTVVLRDTLAFTQIIAGRWDSDPWIDVGVVLNNQGLAGRLSLWFGGAGSPWNWTTAERDIPLDTAVLVTLDCDGDGVLDVVTTPYHSFRTRLFRSGTGKSWRTRSLTEADADASYYREHFFSPKNFGYLSDSLKQYAMFGIAGWIDIVPGIFNNQTMELFGGGVNGPDHTYDAFVPGEFYANIEPLGDVTGDGWNDVIAGDILFGIYDGIAIVFAGGPYIPRDSSASSVEDIAIGGVSDAVSVWPNPVRDELHIAWRGDLRSFPARFTVHNTLGSLVAEGSTEAWRGQAVWSCAAQPAGTYVLRLYSERDFLLAEARIVKY